MAAEAAVTLLQEQVKEVIITYSSDLISSAEQEFKQLNEDLDKLKAMLSNKSSEGEGQKQIREDVYEVQDTIDSWLTQAAAPKGKRSIKKSLGRLDPNRASLGKEVRSLRQDKVKQMLGQAEKMGTAPGPAGGAIMEEQRKMRKDQTMREDKIVGFEDEEKTLTRYLTEAKAALDIISIIGMPGLGKSTLAWKIFHDQRICYEFSIRIWVHVSQRFNLRDACLKIMKKFTGGKDMSGMRDEELSKAVLACLKEEKFLLVMDDVCSNEHWDAFKTVLPYGNGKSKVLITSHHTNVGTHAQITTEPHHLRFLTLDESWQLLQLEVFGDLESCPDELKETGKHIAGKCGGVPLTIVVMGGILKDQLWKTKQGELVRSEWMRISDNPNLGSEINKEKVVSDLIKLSYDGLPYGQIEPFLYLGVFPEDYEIPSWTLTRLWIAEGFICPWEDKSLEEIAEEHLDDLVSRNLLIVSKRDPMGKVKICRVHGMISAFCILKASEKNLFREIKKSEEGEGDALSNKIKDTPRLCLHSRLPPNVKGPRTRSLLFFQNEPVNLDASAIPESFQLLRVLYSKSIRFDKFPQWIITLIHLRYIILCVDDLGTLPESISQIWNLQTIVVDTKSRTLTMKANIWRMIGLRHFKTKAAIILDDTCQGEAGKNLQTLSRLAATESSTAVVSKRASNLKTLGFRGKLATLVDNMSLEGLTRLENLKLESDLESESPYENRLQRLPESDRFPSHLRRLSLSNTLLDWKHMSTLAKICDLEVLKLKHNAFSGISWEAVDYGFERLQYLLIVNADLVLWEASTNTFPSLRSLVLKNCENLKEIPGCLAKHLENLDIDGVRKSAVDSAREIEEAKKQEERRDRGVRFKLSIGAQCHV